MVRQGQQVRRMARGSKSQDGLSPKEALIVEALRRAARPLSAYDLIELLHDEGVSSPPTVYRALKRLTEMGITHRIESLNAFVCCSHGGHNGTAAFAICADCGTVSEFHHDAVASLLGAWAEEQDFSIQKTTIELRGQCHDCGSSTANDKT
jgi:Fur family transcriptional regulator, zinc uptake regulator